MKYHIPTYEECLSIVKNNKYMTFYEKRILYDGYKFSIFNYRLAEYKDFLKNNSFEMKGITFIHHNGKSTHYLMFNKFWELNQYPEFNYNNFKDKKVKKIMIKEDGNLISFIKLPNNKIISRVKGVFNNIFNKTANEFINNNSDYYNFINWCIDNDIVPLFELVGENRMVLEYSKNDLILLNMRNNLTGEYIDKVDYNLNGINLIKKVDYSFDELIYLSKHEENIEGWVVQFEDDTLLKIKTDWYNKTKNKILNILYD